MCECLKTVSQKIGDKIKENIRGEVSSFEKCEFENKMLTFAGGGFRGYAIALPFTVSY